MTVITCVMESMETVKMFAFCSCLRFCKVELNFYEVEILAERYRYQAMVHLTVTRVTRTDFAEARKLFLPEMFHGSH